MILGFSNGLTNITGTHECVIYMRLQETLLKIL